MLIDVPFSRADEQKVRALAREAGLSVEQMTKAAIRLYSDHHNKTKAGEICMWSGDERRARDFAGSANEAPSDGA